MRCMRCMRCSEVHEVHEVPPPFYIFSIDRSGDCRFESCHGRFLDDLGIMHVEANTLACEASKLFEAKRTLLHAKQASCSAPHASHCISCTSCTSCMRCTSLHLSSKVFLLSFIIFPNDYYRTSVNQSQYNSNDRVSISKKSSNYCV